MKKAAEHTIEARMADEAFGPPRTKSLEHLGSRVFCGPLIEVDKVDRNGDFISSEVMDAAIEEFRKRSATDLVYVTPDFIMDLESALGTVLHVRRDRSQVTAEFQAFAHTTPHLMEMVRLQCAEPALGGVIMESTVRGGGEIPKIREIKKLGISSVGLVPPKDKIR